MKIIIFLIPIILLSFPIDYFLSANLKKSKSFVRGEFLVWNDIFDCRLYADMVIYGSSRSWTHINPQILEDSLKVSTYNVGINGHHFSLQYLRHIELIKYNKKPKYILLSLDKNSLEKVPDLYNLDQFIPYMLFNRDIYEYTSTFNGFSSIDYFVPLIRYMGRTDAIFCSLKCAFNIENSKPARIKGFAAMNLEWNDDFIKAKNKMGFYEIKIDFEYEKLFNKFLSDCNTNNIKVILIYSPEYIEGQNFIKNRNEIISLYKQYSNKYRLSYLDYSDNYICQEKKYFYNSSHLNKVGSKLFSSILASDLRKIFISDTDSNLLKMNN